MAPAQNEGAHTVTLTALDISIGHVPMTAGYIVENPGLDLAASLHAAARRVVAKWRLLAGQVEVNPKSKRYQIRIPDVDHSFHPSVHFTTAFHDTSLVIPDVYRAPVNIEATVVDAPPVHYFRDPSIPQTLTEYAAKDAPILSIHLSVLDNCTCVGVTVPHGVFDATGFGLVLKALNSEVKGLDWTPPPSNASEVLDELWETARDDDVKDTLPSGILILQSVLKRWPGVQTILRLAFNILHQYLWPSPSQTPLRRFYLGPNAVSAIVKSVKDSYSTSETVTKGDILWAWLLKASLKHKTGDFDIIAASLMSFRRTLTPLNAVFGIYPHNLALLSFFRLPSIATASLHDLSLLHRRSIHENRTLAYFRAYAKSLDRKRRSVFRNVPNLVPGILAYTNIKTQPVWLHTNISVAGLDQLVLSPTQLPMFFFDGDISPPSMPWHHNLTYTLCNGGIMIQAFMDADVWEAVQEDMAALRNGKVGILSGGC